MDGLLAAADALSALVRGSYGPSGEEVLVFAPPDAPLITADGHAILRARKQQNANADTTATSPFERVILDAAEGVYRESGDGVAQFVLLLRGVLHHIASEGHAAGLERVRMARALGTLRHEWVANRLLPKGAQTHLVVEEPVELSVTATGALTLSPAMHTRVVHVLTTALTGALSQCVVHHLVALVMRWVFTSVQVRKDQYEMRGPLKLVHHHLQLFQRQAPRAIVHAPGGSFEASYALEMDEFVLQKSLIPSQLPSILGGIAPLRFVCITASLDITVGSNQILYEPKDPADAINVVDRLRLRSVQFLTKLREAHDVRLLISTERIEDDVAAACSHLHIACVQFAESEDVDALCSIASVCAITSVLENIREELHVGVCLNGVSPVRHGPSIALRLRGLRTLSSQNEMTVIPQLVVYAPSKAVFKQYYNAMLKSLRVLRCLFTPDHRSPHQTSVRLCRGAGATDLIIAKALRQNEQPEGTTAMDPSLRCVRLAMSSALVEIVVQLRTTLTRGCGSSDKSLASSRRVLLDEMSQSRRWKEIKARGYVLDLDHAISTPLGSVRIPTLVEGDPLEFNILHPWGRLDTIVQAVLHTAERLLRVDAVIRIKRNPERQKTGLHEASDDTDV